MFSPPTTLEASMVHRIRRIDPFSAAKVSAILYFFGGLIAAPFLFLASMMAPDESAVGIGLAIVIPVVYAVMGFIVTLIACALYNLVAGWVGGVQMELE
jgi:hypothetical protein